MKNIYFLSNRKILRTRFLYTFLFLFLFLYFLPQKVFAAAPQILDYPHDTVQMDTSFSVTASMSGLSKNSTYRLRVALAQSGTSNYFGSTFDGNNWHYGSITDGNFISISTDNSGSWNDVIQGKVDSDDPNFTTGSGTYDLKIGRYTQTGTSATWSDAVSVNIFIVPTPTPTPTPTPIPTDTPAPTSIPTVTNTLVPTQKPTSTSIPTKIISPTKYLSTIYPSQSSEEILGTEEAKVATPSSNVTPTKILKQIKTSAKSFPWLIIGSGIICFVGAGGTAWWFAKHGSNNSNNEFS